MSKRWLEENIDLASTGLAIRMKIALQLMERIPGYNPPVEQMRAELNASAIVSKEDCGHTSWCDRYGLPTSQHACEVCVEARKDDPSFGVMMRYLGDKWRATLCKHLTDTGKVVRRKCCGNLEKDFIVYECGLNHSVPQCSTCEKKRI